MQPPLYKSSYFVSIKSLDKAPKHAYLPETTFKRLKTIRYLHTCIQEKEQQIKTLIRKLQPLSSKIPDECQADIEKLLNLETNVCLIQRTKYSLAQAIASELQQSIHAAQCLISKPQDNRQITTESMIDSLKYSLSCQPNGPTDYPPPLPPPTPPPTQVASATPSRPQSAVPSEAPQSAPGSAIDPAGPVYCLCQLQDNGETMVGCDSGSRCRYGEWFHPPCLGLEVVSAAVSQLDSFHCPGCWVMQLSNSIHEWRPLSLLPEVQRPACLEHIRNHMMRLFQVDIMQKKRGRRRR
eukprot:gnl/Dysnectes_brevis/2213_a2580_1203.p1 GENE.gnl/Dysnectes_brevis/2213_a2580_1203~~gnl/Dysnectes_brevis/2213_a2580_1203.p1  ORF type:complete len:295 (-),score=29.69 gnl/Dysnectes_brevis/2213_a2580_1203:58-942(-)